MSTGPTGADQHSQEILYFTDWSQIKKCNVLKLDQYLVNLIYVLVDMVFGSVS